MNKKCLVLAFINNCLSFGVIFRSVIPIKQVLEERPNICLLAEFPTEGRLVFSYFGCKVRSQLYLEFNFLVSSGLLCSYIEIDQMFDSELNSDISLPSQLSSHTSDGSMFMSFSESSYTSDHGSGNEDGRDAGLVIYEESSDEVDFLTL